MMMMQPPRASQPNARVYPKDVDSENVNDDFSGPDTDADETPKISQASIRVYPKEVHFFAKFPNIKRSIVLRTFSYCYGDIQKTVNKLELFTRLQCTGMLYSDNEDDGDDDDDDGSEPDTGEETETQPSYIVVVTGTEYEIIREHSEGDDATGLRPGRSRYQRTPDPQC